MRIGIDIDEVLYPWYDQAHAASVAAGITNGVTPTSWAPYDDYGCTDRDWYDALDAATLTDPSPLYTADPIPGAVQAMHSMAAAGHRLHIVTARGLFKHGARIRALTVEWLDFWRVPFDSLTFSDDKTAVRVDIFIDDHIRHVRALLGVGVRAVLHTTPSNVGETWPLRVASLAEFAELVHQSEEVTAW